MSKKAETRRSDWIQAVSNNPNFLESKNLRKKLILAYQKGSVIMRHPSLIDLRQKSEKANLYNRTYEQSVDKAKRLEKEQQAAMLEKLLYKQDDPLRKYFLRPRDQIVEIQPPMRYQPRDKMERIK